MNFWDALLGSSLLSEAEQIAARNEWKFLVGQSYRRDVEKQAFLDLPAITKPKANV